MCDEGLFNTEKLCSECNAPMNLKKTSGQKIAIFCVYLCREVCMTSMDAALHFPKWWKQVTVNETQSI